VGFGPRKANPRNGCSRVLIGVLNDDQVKETRDFREHLKRQGQQGSALQIRIEG
jgi:hypothetical protein